LTQLIGDLDHLLGHLAVITLQTIDFGLKLLFLIFFLLESLVSLQEQPLIFLLLREHILLKLRLNCAQFGLVVSLRRF